MPNGGVQISGVMMAGSWDRVTAGTATPAGRMMPPIRRARVIARPDDDMMVVPIAIVVQPPSNGKAVTERHKKAGAGTTLHEDHFRLIDRHVNHVRIRGNDVNVTIVGNDLLLWIALKIAESLGLGA
jgi:hypothetical protein